MTCDKNVCSQLHILSISYFYNLFISDGLLITDPGNMDAQLYMA